MSSRLREIASSALGKFGIVGIADVHICADADGGAPYDYWNQWARAEKDVFHTALSTAHDATVTGRNDVVLLTPDNHTQTAAITWSRNMTHLVGMYPPQMMNQRSRIGHSADIAAFLTVSGYGNCFANIHLMYGRDGASNLNSLTVSGNRNSFYYCHFPVYHATPLDQSGFDLVKLNCGEVYFNHCFFGNDTVAWTDGDMIRFYGPADRSTRAIFEDCIFMMNADNNQVNFIETVAGNGAGVSIFKGCTFFNMGTTITLAIDGTGLGNQKFYFDPECAFYGVTDICTNGKDTNILCGHDYGGASDADNLIAGFADHT